jgi:hypothetical protein
MYHQEMKQRVISLRKDGYSYNYITEHTHIPKSTLSEWLQDIPFHPNKHTIETIGNARIASGIYKHNLKIESLNEAKIEAKKDIGDLSRRDIMMLGLGMYIGEGSKTMNMTRISNTDPLIIRFTIKWLEKSFGIEKKNLKIRLHLYPDNNEKESIEYWSKEVGISIDQFFKSSIDRRTNKKMSNEGKSPHGTAHLSVRSMGNKKFGAYLHRLIMAWINEVLC